MNHHEFDMHVEFYTLCCYHHLEPYVFAIEHGEKKSAATGARLRKKGVKKEKGIADFLITYPFKSCRALWIEFKYDKNKQNEYQLAFEELVMELGYRYIVSYEAQSALDFIKTMIKEDEAQASYIAVGPYLSSK